jgi:TDG/mug DNA glycosylase family protein
MDFEKSRALGYNFFMLKAFPPIWKSDAKVLILGCMPGVKSLEMSQYYGHPQNTFWFICGELFGAKPELPYQDRCKILQKNRIALWDVLHACHRKGSLDANIETRSMMPNDFKKIFRQLPNMRAVFFNGATPEKIFRSRVLPTLPEKFQQLHYQRLPSTSPAYASLNRQQKLQQWRVILDWL